MNQIALPYASEPRSRRHFIVFLLACVVTLAMFFWQGNKGLNLPDEGFFWYGVQRVLAGEVPFRDFMAYDPGRYYWSGAVMKLLGSDRLWTLRASAAVFQATGVYIALRLLDRQSGTARPMVLATAAVALNAWMYPWFKVFDIVPSIALVAGLAFVLEKPISRRFFIAGVVVGLAAVFGRNHGVYGVAGSLGAMVYLAIRRDTRLAPLPALFAWAAGIVAGFLPILLMALLIPGFALAFWQSIIFLLSELKGTNIPLPVPWPWLVQVGKISSLDAATESAQGAFFVALLGFGILAPLGVLLQRFRGTRVPPALVAASMLALPYAHYSFSRADTVHLAQGIFPMLIGLFALLMNRPGCARCLAAALLCGLSVLTVLPADPGWQCHRHANCVNVEAGGSKIKVSASIARDVELIKKFGNAADAEASDKASILIMPFWPGAYALLNRKSPTWEIYALFRRSQAFEQAELDRIQAAAPTLAMINDAPLDDRDELRFRNTHPLIYQYVMDNFELVKDFSEDPWNLVYRRKRTTPRTEP